MKTVTKTVEQPNVVLDYDRKGLLAHIRQQFQINWHGTHGASHWSRVLHHGKHIGCQTGADPLIIELFAFLHDSCRWDEYCDPDHGPRAAEFTHGLNGRFFNLTGKQLDDLCFAIRHHSGGDVSTNVTVQTCWDADRLDLWRVGITPSPRYISDIAFDRLDHAFDLCIKSKKNRHI